jgi:tetratricopeptide (TPR) repeat protein
MKAPAAIVCLFLALAGARVYGAEDPVAEGTEAFYNLDYETALSSWEKALAADPANPQRHNNIAYALLYREMFRNGALESELVSGNNSFIRRAKMEPSLEVERRFFAEIERSMELCQARLRTNPRDTVALHALAVAYGLRANYGFLVRKSWRMSLYDSSQARKFDAEVTEIDPTDYDSRLIQGAWDYITGSLSWSMRAVGFLAGVHGDKERGLRTIEEVVQKGKQNREDAEIILCALYRRDGQTTRAIPHVLRLVDRFPRNYLIRFELAQMYAATGQRRSALDTINQIAAMKQQNVPGFERIPWQKIYYETGNLQFWFGDLDHALENLRKATLNPDQMKDLDLNTGSLAYMRQGQIYDLLKRHNLAVAEYEQAMKFAPEADAARESQHYIGSPYTRAVRTHS